MAEENYMEGGVVFPPFKTHYTIMGIRGVYWARILVVLGIGTLLFFFLGMFSVQTEQSLSMTEHSTYSSQLREMQEALGEVQSAAGAAGTSDWSKLDVDSETLELAEQAKTLGVTTDMDKAALESFIPETKEVQGERFPVLQRLFACILIPFLVVFMWHMEFQNGWSMHSETKRLNKYRKRQRFAVSRKNTYLYGEDGWK